MALPNRTTRSTLLLLLATASLLPLAACGKHAKSNNPNGPKPLLTDTALQVGGEDVVTLRRAAAGDSTTPQFVSATILPGRGFNLFQITANLPGKGEVQLLASPGIEEAASKLNLGPGDANGVASFSFGGAFLVPYPNRIIGQLTEDGNNVTTSWQGHQLTLPADFGGKNGIRKHAIHGLILASKVENIQKTTTADGQRVTGLLHAGNFGGHWLSSTDLSFGIDLAGDAVNAVITAKNVGSVAEPMSIGWHPYFAIPSDDRAQVRLHIPAQKYAVVDNYNDVFPTGELKPVAGTPYDFNLVGGKPLGQQFLDDNFSTLTRDNGAVDVELSDPASRYGIRVEGLSPEIKTVQVYAPPSKQFVAIEQQFNFADPFGGEWKNMDTGMVTLQPGQSVTWRVRLQLFVPQPPPAPPMPKLPGDVEKELK